MSRIIYRQLIGHEDLSLGQGKIVQERGDRTVSIQQIELEFIFRTVDEIKALDYIRYGHVALYKIGPVFQYYFDWLSMAVPDNITVIKPNSILASLPGRYILSAGQGIYDTIIASASDEDTPIAVDLVTAKTTFRAPYPLALAYVRASLTTPPTGASFIVDVHMNGVTMFSTLLSIDPTEKTSVTASVPAVLSVTSVPDDAEFTVFVTQVGSTLAGTGLKIAVTGIKVA